MRKEIKDYVELYLLDKWDWIAVGIAIFSLVIAVISLMFAYRTLKSQKQTEKNTQPIISDSIQEFLLNMFIVQLLDGEISINALWHLLDGKSYKFYPSESILEKVKIPLDNIHTEVFYGRDVKHHCLKGLLDMVIEYNINISTLNSHLSNPKITVDMLSREFGVLLNQNVKIAEIWKKNMGILFQYDAEKYSSVFESEIRNVQYDADYETEYYEGEDVYAEFFIDEKDKKKLLIFKDNRVRNLISEYNDFLIPKI